MQKQNTQNFNVLIITLFILLLICSCNKKVGVKPGGKLDSAKEKCKCKKRKGLYSTLDQKKQFYTFEQNHIYES